MRKLIEKVLLSLGKTIKTNEDYKLRQLNMGKGATARRHPGPLQDFNFLDTADY